MRGSGERAALATDQELYALVQSTLEQIQAISATLPSMPQSQHIDCRILNLVTHLIMPDKQPPDLARGERKELLTDARIGQQDGRSLGQCLHRP